MSERLTGPLMDPTRGAVCAMTMVGGDHFFLRRWVAHYGRELGRENLFILSHGGDPEHRKIAEGANILYLPHDATRTCFNQRRWQMLSRFTSGFTRFYNWVICGDVDELVVVDPAEGVGLVDYLARMGGNRMRPKVLTPFAIEMVHMPALEPEALTDEAPILGRRRHFRLNANYAKPCVVRDIIDFVPGGHFANHPVLTLDPHLYLFHLRFIDYAMTEARLATRRAQRVTQSGALGESDRAVTGWDTAWATYQALAKEEPRGERIDFPEFRQEMIDGWRQKKVVYWAPGGARPRGIYRLPARFTGVF